MRAGTQALTLLSIPVNMFVLEALASQPRSLVALRRAAGAPPQTTMRGYLRTLTETGVLIRNRQGHFSGTVEFDLTDAGRDLLIVKDALQAWLKLGPDGPLEPGGAAARSATKALVGGWGTSIVRVLALKPHSLTELDTLITGLSYPSLERRLAAMRLAGQVEKTVERGRWTGAPYAVTDWLRRAAAPVAAAARWERWHLREQATPIAPGDAEAAFLLCLPLVRLPAEIAGACRLAVEFRAGKTLAGVVARFEGGRVVSCAPQLEGAANAWAAGSVDEWLHAVIDEDPSQLEIGGDWDLVGAVTDGLYRTLFAASGAAER